MSTANPTLSYASDSDVLNRVMRMVIPMRREHNRSLEVRQFMNDLAYAKDIINQALASKDDKLQENGAYLSNKIFGPRNDAQSAVVSPKPIATAAASVPANTVAEEESEAAMRARMMAKYKTGLR
jgi:hypothetical protein